MEDEMGIASRIIKTAGAGSAFGAALFAAPLAQAAPSGTWMDISLSAKAVGNTVTVTYADKGVQHLHADGTKTFSSNESGGYQIDFGDGSAPMGANGMGGSQCANTGTAPFYTRTAGTPSHTYIKAGTYVITATGSYCGAGGEKTVTKKVTVTVGAADTTKSIPVPSAASPVPFGHTSGATKPIGPQVQTDHVASSNSNSNTPSDLALVGLTLSGLAVGAARARRRS